MDEDIKGLWLGTEKAPGDKEDVGDGDGVYAVHGALLRSGRVLLWTGGLENSDFEDEVLFRSWSWDPATYVPGGALTGVEGRWFLSEFDPGGPRASPPGDRPVYDDFADIDLFCAHHVTLEDGRLLAVGGTKEPDFSRGNHAVFTYDPDGERWSRHLPGLVNGRWYPTAVVLADGRVAVFSGRPDSWIEESAEILNSESLTPQLISGGDRTLYIYPGLVMVPGGELFYVPTAWQYERADDTAEVRSVLGPTASFRMTGDTSGRWTEYDDPIDPTQPLYPSNILREEGTFVLLPPAQAGRIMVIGGGYALDPNDRDSASQQSTEMDLCEILHTQGGDPRWSIAGRMRRQRSNVHAVLLPHGKVLVLGGHDGAKRVHANDHLIPEMYDPTVPFDPADPHAAFTDLAPMTSSRLYHATALLLPDGRVLVAGGEDQDHAWPHQHGSNLHSFEIYEPPYLHQGDQPTITSISADDRPEDELAYGGHLRIETPDAANIASVVLMRLGSATHHTDTEQRYVPLSFSSVGSRLNVEVVDDPTVAPPGYYMLFIVDDEERPCEQSRMVRLSHRRCRLITDRSTFSSDELTPGTTVFPTSFYVQLDGFLPSELGITTASPSPAQLSSWAPPIDFLEGTTVIGGITERPTGLHLEDPTLPEGRRQRVTFEYAVEISDADIFPPDGVDLRTLSVRSTATVDVHGTDRDWLCGGQIRLTRQANPYMLDGPTHWLSMDVRVFKVRSGADPFGMSTPVTDPTGYIQELLTEWTGLPEAGHPFQSLTEDQADSALQLASTEGGQPVYNFAVARVRYRGQSLSATDARVFFRMFSTATTNMTYDETATYRRHTRPGGQTVPLLGTRSGELASMPFFAVPRLDSTTFSMEDQPEDGPNKQTFTPTGGGEDSRYFGAWLDINQGIGRFVTDPGGSNGPFAPGAVKSIRDLIAGRHQCLVAEIYFGDDPTPPGATPANNDNLSQRNLAIEGADNPGGPDGHTLGMTFEIDPTWHVRGGFRDLDTTIRFAAVRADMDAPPRPEGTGHAGADDVVPEPHDHAEEEPAGAAHAANGGAEEGRVHVHARRVALRRLAREEVLPPAMLRLADDLAGPIHDRRAGLLAKLPATGAAWHTPTVAYRPGHHEHAAKPTFNWIRPDELMIDWGGLPTGAYAELYIPGVRADDVLRLLDRRWVAERFGRVDEHTLSVPVGGMTHVPIPAYVPGPLEALLTLRLPDTVRMRQSFTVRIHQVSVVRRRVVGTVELRVPVSSGPQLLAADARWLAVLKDMVAQRDERDRWRPVLERLLRIVEGRVEAFGLDPAAVPASPDGFDLPGGDGPWTPFDPFVPGDGTDGPDGGPHCHGGPGHGKPGGGRPGDHGGWGGHPRACGCWVCQLLEPIIGHAPGRDRGGGWIGRGVHVCDCGPRCECGYSATRPGSCPCGRRTVYRKVLAEDADYFYVSRTGPGVVGTDRLGAKPFTCAGGNPLQRFPKSGR